MADIEMLLVTNVLRGSKLALGMLALLGPPHRVLGQWLSLQRSLFNSSSTLTQISNTTVMTTPTNVRVVDLRSDTLTKPTQEMRRAMFEAEVGDDVYGEDPTVNALEKKAAAMLNKEGGLFLPSATMSNLVVERGCEVIAGDSSHMFLFEQGGAAQLGGVQMCTLPNKSNGTFDLDLMESKVRSGNDSLHEPITSAHLRREHTQCLWGKVLPLDWLDEGARVRKVLGGGMRQAGVLAAAGLVALDKMVDRLELDHRRAADIAKAIATFNSAKFTVDLENHQTNILFININSNNITSHNFCQRLATVLDQDPAGSGETLSVAQDRVRLVTYHEVNDEDTAAVINKLLLVMRELQ